jgi:beta-aspartyl-peptidase (threonine type)
MRFTIAIHGGAGTILRKEMTPELEKRYVLALQESLDAGYKALLAGKSAIDAVVASVIALEDNVLFNAGKGSVFNSEGQHEMDAALMDGSNLMAGAVTGVRNIRNPIELARKIMLNSNHVFMSGQGAMDFAIQQGIASETDEYFFSQHRFDQWKRTQESDSIVLDHTSLDNNSDVTKEKKFGTVGAVACDAHGNIAAATSTGGMTNKKFGRVGDSPLIGCGTYANNKTCAISCTGHGEPFIRAVAAYDVSCLMEYKGLTLQEAMEKVVFEKLISLDGEGGMIGVDATGNAAMLFNSEGMYRGFKKNNGEEEIAIYSNGQ